MQMQALPCYPDGALPFRCPCCAVAWSTNARLKQHVLLCHPSNFDLMFDDADVVTKKAAAKSLPPAAPPAAPPRRPVGRPRKKLLQPAAVNVPQAPNLEDVRPDTHPDTVPDAVRVPDTVPGIVPNPVPDTVLDTVPDTVPNPVPDTVPVAFEDVSWRCCISCDLMIRGFAALMEHNAKFHQGRATHQCPYCDQTFDQNNQLSDHIKRIHASLNESFTTLSVKSETQALSSPMSPPPQGEAKPTECDPSSSAEKRGGGYPLLALKARRDLFTKDYEEHQRKQKGMQKTTRSTMCYACHSVVDDLRSHVNSIHRGHSGSRFQCIICSVNYQKHNLLRWHCISEHPSYFPEESSATSQAPESTVQECGVSTPGCQINPTLSISEPGADHVNVKLVSEGPGTKLDLHTPYSTGSMTKRRVGRPFKMILTKNGLGNHQWRLKTVPNSLHKLGKASKETVSTKNGTKCYACLKIVDNLRSHVNSIHRGSSGSRFQCTVCSEYFKNHCTLRWHCLSEHGSHFPQEITATPQAEKEPIPQAEKEPIPQEVVASTADSQTIISQNTVLSPKRKDAQSWCYQCHIRVGSLQSHLYQVHVRGKLSCTNCPKRFVFHKKLKEHWLQYHGYDNVGIAKINPSTDEPSSCSNFNQTAWQFCYACEQSFPAKQMLSHKIRFHYIQNGTNQFSCPRCVLVFHREPELRKHCQKVHNMTAPKAPVLLSEVTNKTESFAVASNEEVLMVSSPKAVVKEMPTAEREEMTSTSSVPNDKVVVLSKSVISSELTSPISSEEISHPTNPTEELSTPKHDPMVSEQPVVYDITE